MIAKIVKGSNFRGVVNYILDKGKNAKILVCDGLFAENKETITNSFEAQASMFQLPHLKISDLSRE